MNKNVSAANTFMEIEKLRTALKERVYDQDDAVDAVADALMQLTYKPAETSPQTVFTFLGPPAAGKVYLAAMMTELLEGYQNFRAFDMGQYGDPDDAPRLLSENPTIDGVPEGELIRFLQAHPQSVVLFEEIEKADNQIQLELLDLITGKNEQSSIDCRDTIVIFTSTLGSALYQNRHFMDRFKNDRLYAQTLIIEALSQEQEIEMDFARHAIDPKLLSVMAEHVIMLFNRLSLNSIIRIGAESLSRSSEHFIEKTGIELCYENREPLIKLVTLSFAPYINPKRIGQKLPDVIFYQITQYMRNAQTPPEKVTLGLSGAALDFLKDIYRETETLPQALFKKNQTVELTWTTDARDGSVRFTLDRAELIKIPPSKMFFREERPRVEFSTISFDDIAGNKPSKSTLRQIIRILKDPERVKKFGIEMPKGLLLYGAKGVGKTMLGKAFANEAELPLIVVSGAELFDPPFIQMAYYKARQIGSCIVFLDEIDIKGIMEGIYANVPPEPLLRELDALPSNADELIFTVATAKSRDDIHPDLLAPGRIDMFVEVPDLDREARRFFIEKILEKPNDGNIDVEKVVRYISGMSGYDLQRIGQEASLYALRNDLDCITEEILIEQINIIKYGYKLEKKHIRNLEEDLKKTAFHESGHAVLSYLLLPDIKIEQVTIAPRIETLGFVSYSTEDFAGNVTKTELLNNICVLLGGRVTQVKKFGPEGIDTGAANDLEQATYEAYVAIANLGMDDELGCIHVDTLAQNINRQMFQRKVEDRIRYWIADATRKAENLVDQHMDKIEVLAATLLQKEIVDGSELDKIMKA